jgi:hypothetical protein
MRDLRVTSRKAAICVKNAGSGLHLGAGRDVAPGCNFWPRYAAALAVGAARCYSGPVNGFSGRFGMGSGF